MSLCPTGNGGSILRWQPRVVLCSCGPSTKFDTFMDSVLHSTCACLSYCGLPVSLNQSGCSHLSFLTNKPSLLVTWCMFFIIKSVVVKIPEDQQILKSMVKVTYSRGPLSFILMFGQWNSTSQPIHSLCACFMFQQCNLVHHFMDCHSFSHLTLTFIPVHFKNIYLFEVVYCLEVPSLY